MKTSSIITILNVIIAPRRKNPIITSMVSFEFFLLSLFGVESGEEEPTPGIIEEPRLGANVGKESTVSFGGGIVTFTATKQKFSTK